MTVLIAFISGLAGAASGLLIYQQGKLAGRREQIESNENQRRLLESLSFSKYEAEMRKFAERNEKAANKKD